MVGELVSDHSAISATVQDILHVAPAGGGGANTGFGANDKAIAVDTVINTEIFTFYASSLCKIRVVKSYYIKVKGGKSSHTFAFVVVCIAGNGWMAQSR